MKALVVQQHGADPVSAEFEDPQAGDGEQVVEMVAAGIHPIVRKLASGKHYGDDGVIPRIPGVDGVARFPGGSYGYVGFARSPYGTVSERTVIPAGWSIPLPDGADPVAVAGTLNPAMSAWVSLVHVGGLQSGQRVLVLGATGTSGRVAVQLALELGATVVAAGRNPDALEELAHLGASPVSIAGEPDEYRAGLAAALVTPPDLVIDYLWGTVAETTISVLTRTGMTHHASRIRWVEVGEVAGETLTLPAAALRSSGLEFVGSGAGSVDPALIAGAIPDMMRRIASGAVQVPVRAVTLAEAEGAWAEAETPGTRLVVTV